jgi:hypothetical protein
MSMTAIAPRHAPTLIERLAKQASGRVIDHLDGTVTVDMEWLHSYTELVMSVAQPTLSGRLHNALEMLDAMRAGVDAAPDLHRLDGVRHETG